MQTIRISSHTRKREKVKREYDYHCSLCERFISVGEKYTKTVYTYDGDFYVSKVHDECNSLINDLISLGTVSLIFK